MSEESLKDMYMAIPPFTRYFITSVFVTSFGMTYKLINPYYLILEPSVIKKLQIWRFFTSFIFAGSFSQSFLFSIIMMYFTIRRCEEHFKNKNADFALLVIFMMFACLFYSLIYGDYMILHN